MNNSLGIRIEAHMFLCWGEEQNLSLKKVLNQDGPMLVGLKERKLLEEKEVGSWWKKDK